MDYNKIQPIIEVYTAIQTEGSKSGIPHILIRTTGCTHRCYFGEGGWCDSWYTSIHPEKGTWTLKAIEDFMVKNKSIDHLMITGGSPTMHPQLVDTLVTMFKDLHANDMKPVVNWQDKGFITLETEGSHFIKTEHPIDLISLSPKFENSIPKLDSLTPQGKVVDQKMIDQHNKFRMDFDAMSQMINYHKDYHLKPVVDQNDADFIWEDIDKITFALSIPNDKVWVMPAGDTRENLILNYAYTIEECVRRGYNFTGRDHIIAFGDKRGV